MAAILEISGHIEMILTLKWHVYHQILKNGGHIEILHGPRYFPAGGPLKNICTKICCLYHNLKDSYTYLFRYNDEFLCILVINVHEQHARG